MSQSGILNLASDLPPDVPLIFEGNTGAGSAILNVFEILGSGNVSTSVVDNVLTISYSGSSSGIQTLTGNSGGPISPTANNINTLGAGSITIVGSGSTLTTQLTGLTQYAVQVGGPSTTLTQVGPGATNTVLLGNTGANPSFGTVPNAALTNDSVTLNNGNNITVTGGNPLVLGGTASFNLTGTTQHALQIGNVSGSLTSIAIGSTGQVLQANTTADPTWSTATYPSTTTVNDILYSSSNNVVGQITAGDYGVLISSSSGVPSWLANGTTGQVLTATTGSTPSWSAAAGGGITTIDGDSGSITGTTVTISGGTTGLTTSGSSATMDLTGTLIVENGGTGVATMTTAYAPICAGTSATGALQVASSGLNTSGYVLTSNGSSSLPSFQAPSGSFAPNSVINFYSDFTDNLELSSFWEKSSGTLNGTTNSQTNPGIVNIANGITSSNSYIYIGVPTCGYILGGGALNANWVISLGTLSNTTNTYSVIVGLADSITSIANGCYFTYTNATNSGQWVCNCIAASSTTSSNTSTAAVTGFVNLGIQVNAGGTSVAFTINGSVVETIISNIPTAAVINAQFRITWIKGTVTAGVADLFYLTQTLTTAR